MATRGNGGELGRARSSHKFQTRRLTGFCRSDLRFVHHGNRLLYWFWFVTPGQLTRSTLEGAPGPGCLDTTAQHQRHCRRCGGSDRPRRKLLCPIQQITFPAGIRTDRVEPLASGISSSKQALRRSGFTTEAFDVVAAAAHLIRYKSAIALDVEEFRWDLALGKPSQWRSDRRIL